MLSKHSTSSRRHDFGRELRRLRRSAGLSLRSLANRVGVDFSYLSKIETGSLPPASEGTLRKLAHALKRPPDALLLLARKVPSDLQTILCENEHIPAFLRMANRQRLSQAQWEELTRWLAERRRREPILPARFSDAFLADRLLQRMAVELPSRRQLVFVEMSGLRSHNLVRAALSSLLDGRVRLLDAPLTTNSLKEEFASQAARLARLRQIQLLAYPELLSDPGVRECLGAVTRRGIETVFSAPQAVERAASHPKRKVVLLATGFETTAAAVALATVEARRRGVKNFLVLASLRSMLAAIDEVARRGSIATHGSPDIQLDGIIAPGHVAAIVGLDPFRRIARAYRIPIVVAGFEILDLLCSLLLLVRQARARQASSQNQYGRVVRDYGNPEACRLIAEVFETVDGTWDAIGSVPKGVFRVREEYREFDAGRTPPA